MYNLGETGFFVSILTHELFRPMQEDLSFEAEVSTPAGLREKALN